MFFLFLVVTGCAVDETPLPAPKLQDEATDVVEAPQEETDDVASTVAVDPTPTPASEPQAPTPPLVLYSIPERGEAQSLDQPIELHFDQAMDRDSVEKAFAIEPGASVDGSFEWVDDQTLRFSLKDGYQRGQRYRVRVVETAKSAAGCSMRGAI